MTHTTTLPDVAEFEQADVEQQFAGPDDITPEAQAGPGAAYAAAMDLAVDGHHVHFAASGETECLTGDCGFSVAGQLLNGVL